MYDILLHSHSGLRWIVLILIVGALAKAISGMASGAAYGPMDNKLSLFSLISCHIMLLLGFVLYFVSPIVQSGLMNMGSAMKDPVLRFWTVEHLSVMIIGIVLITIGRIRLKKLDNDAAKHKNIVIFFGIGLLLILSRIPWPFMEGFSGRGWF
ncbi:MAG: hypothetical protein ACI85F_003052 [Bacteroidia bacterium]|jgi:hypothetical protein